ncbi:hypothetical protein [Paenibacillus sp. PL2-23]|uniref:hypothetical protein n=1 Tax=Paenibacillus sp. PL2-23 TaxID=2100729 RepID=UPI0030F8C1EC
MYMPGNKGLLGMDRTERKGSRRRRQPLFSIGGALVLLLLLIIAALVMNERQGEGAPSGLSHDLGKLWEWTDAAMLGGAAESDWHLRWRLETEDEDAFDELAAGLFRDGQGGELAKIVTNDGSSIQGQSPVYGGATLSIHRAEVSVQGVVLLVGLDRKGGGGLTLSELDRWATAISEKVAAVSPTVVPSIKTHGYTADRDVLQQLKRLAQAKEIDRYEDGGTSSVTMKSSTLRLTQAMGPGQGHDANMQLALHANTEREEAELTIGIPLLTGEFGSLFE